MNDLLPRVACLAPEKRARIALRTQFQPFLHSLPIGDNSHGHHFKP